MGENYHGLVGSVSYSGGTSSSVSEVISTVRDSHLFVSYIRQREADSSVGGSSVFDLERSNREGSGSFSIARFLLPSGGMRPVTDLSILNTFLLVPHFKMETNRSIRSCIHPGMWTTNLDLMDAYFHIPIAPPLRKFSVSRGTLQNRPGSHFSTRGKICISLSENSVVPTLRS